MSGGVQLSLLVAADVNIVITEPFFADETLQHR